jgi:hypothetical protein
MEVGVVGFIIEPLLEEKNHSCLLTTYDHIHLLIFIWYFYSIVIIASDLSNVKDLILQRPLKQVSYIFSIVRSINSTFFS